MISILIPKLAGLGILFLLGHIFGRRNLLSETVVKGLAWLVIDVTMPALFFCGVYKIGFSLENKGILTAFVGGFVVSCLGMALAWPVLKFFPLENKQKGAFWFTCCIGNSSFLPLPISIALWGDQGAVACLAYILGNNIFLFSLGLGLLRGLKKPEKADILMIFLHPQALAFGLGLLLFGLGISLPAWLLEATDGLGKATLPLAMLVSGAILAQAEVVWKGRAPLLGAMAAVKLLALPLAVLLALKPFKNGAFGGVGASVVMLQAAMPSLASAGVYARRFQGDAALAAGGSLVSTLLCPLTLAFWMALWEAGSSNF